MMLEGAGTATGSEQGQEQAMWAVHEPALPPEILIKQKCHTDRLGCLHFKLAKSYEYILYQNTMKVYIKCQQQDLQESPTIHFKMFPFLDLIFIMSIIPVSCKSACRGNLAAQWSLRSQNWNKNNPSQAILIFKNLFWKTRSVWQLYLDPTWIIYICKNKP